MGETKKNENELNNNHKNILELVNDISIEQKIINSFNKLNNKENIENKKEYFTNFKECDNVEFKKYKHKFCYIKDENFYCFNNKFVFGINQKLDSAISSLLDYLNKQSDPINCLEKRSIILKLKKWDLFNSDEKGFYLERYKKMFSILISSGNLSKDTVSKLKLQVKIINKMIEIRFQLRNQDFFNKEDNQH